MSPAPTNRDARPTRLLLYDGDCGFCTRAADRARRLAPGCDVRPYQVVDVAEHGLTVAECQEALRYVTPTGTYAGAEAVARLLHDSDRRAAALAGRVLATGSAQALARPTYAWVSRHRGRLPGGCATCGRD